MLLTLKNFKDLQADKSRLLKIKVESPSGKECIRLNVIRINKQLAEFNQVQLSFMCGGEFYEQAVFKIGSKYFDGSRAVTYSNGYSLIEEV